MNQATFRARWSQTDFLEGCARRGIRCVSLWLDGEAGPAPSGVRQHLARLDLQVSGIHRIGPVDFATAGGGLPDRERAAAIIEAAAELGADHVFLFTGGLPEGSTDLPGAWHRVQDVASWALDRCTAVGVRLALEPLHPMLMGDRTVICSLKQALALSRALGPNAGVVVDVHHVWWDPDLADLVRQAGAEGRILGFHVSDWRNPTRHRLTDRAMVGDGIIPLRAIWHQLVEAGFDGPVEVEIFSEFWWDQDPDATLALAIERCRQTFI